ncbi:MAG: hypothetical protein M5U19_05755 [Microthrixaceae bacterium]|nr:hypothetical protein [Microthrixaceae bacterium]
MPETNSRLSSPSLSQTTASRPLTIEMKRSWAAFVVRVRVASATPVPTVVKAKASITAGHPAGACANDTTASPTSKARPYSTATSGPCHSTSSVIAPSAMRLPAAMDSGTSHITTRTSTRSEIPSAAGGRRLRAMAPSACRSTAKAMIATDRPISTRWSPSIGSVAMVAPITTAVTILTCTTVR